MPFQIWLTQSQMTMLSPTQTLTATPRCPQTEKRRAQGSKMDQDVSDHVGFDSQLGQFVWCSGLWPYLHNISLKNKKVFFPFFKKNENDCGLHGKAEMSENDVVCRQGLYLVM